MSKYIGSRVELLQLKIWMFKSNPHDIVKCDMDCFSPYTLIQKSPEMEELYSKQCSECQIEFDDLADEYLSYLQYGDDILNPDELIKEYEKEIDDLLNRVLLK